MTAFYKFDLKSRCLAQAQAAARRAEASSDKAGKNDWLELSASWKYLAGLQAGDCYCGQPAIGCKLLPNGERLAVCGPHLTELLADGIERQ